MSRTRQAVRIAMMPLIAGAIYLWLLRHAIGDAKTIIGRRFGGWEPIEHP